MSIDYNSSSHRKKAMNISRPTWELAQGKCDYDDQGELIFSTCPTCSTIVLICGECGTVYEIEDKKAGKEVGEISGNTRCHICQTHFQHNFSYSTSQEIAALGFTPNEYK